jgi:hypothetical protein
VDKPVNSLIFLDFLPLPNFWATVSVFMHTIHTPAGKSCAWAVDTCASLLIVKLFLPSPIF